jgi:threonine synthase
MHDERRVFGLEIRRFVDSMYLREPRTDSPLWRLVNDSLPRTECQSFYLGIRDSLEIFNRVLIPRLVEAAPTPRVRREILPVLTVEFGPGVDAAHPTLFERFLVALGVPEDASGPSPDVETKCRDEIASIRGMTWCELLARILVGETQGPVSFPAIAAALQRNYGLSQRDVRYFTLHAAHDKKDTEILIGLIEREARSVDEKRSVLRTLEREFGAGRYLHTACKLASGPAYRFAEIVPSAPAVPEAPEDAGHAAETIPRSSASPSDASRLAALRSASTTENPLGSLDPKRRSMEGWLGACWARLENDSTCRDTQIGGLLHRTLAPAELGPLWRALAPCLLAQENPIASRLIERCEDLKTRIALWSIARPFYGWSDAHPSYSELLNRFVAALGVDLDPADVTAAGARARKLADELDLHRLLAVGVLAPVVLARFAFPAIRRALASEPYGMPREALAFFDAASENADVALHAVAQVAERYFDGDPSRRVATDAVTEYLRAFMQGRDPLRAEGAAAHDPPELAPAAFEQQLRELCDQVYATPSRLGVDNPMVRLRQGQLSRTEARDFWAARWNRVLVLTRYILPNLLRRSPDFRHSVTLCRSIQVEYGGGDFDKAHPVLYRRFLSALGVPPTSCPMSLPMDDPAVLRDVRRIEEQSWLELVGEFLARETVGPKVFAGIAGELRRQFGLTDDDVAWFTVHAAQDQDDADDMFRLVRSLGVTASAQRTLRSAMLGWFENNPWYCCDLGETVVRFTKEPRSRSGPLSSSVRDPVRRAAPTAAPRFDESCVRCGKRFSSDRFNTRCDACGGLIDVTYDLRRVEIHAQERDAIARYRDLIPVQDPSQLVRVGAGNTPCVHAKALGKRLGLANLFLKNETTNPTRTIKDRTAEVVLSYLQERKIFHFTSSATGNSSTAFACACIAHPPFEHSIFIGERWLPRLTFDANPRIHVWVLEGEAGSVEAIAYSRQWEKANGIPSEGGFFNAGRREGLKLAFLEAVDQLETSFDWYVQGTSTAMGAYGSHKGALQYVALGRMDRPPKMALAQETTCCPQVHAFAEGSPEIRPHHIVKQPDGIADALLKGNPSDTYPYIYEMLQRVGGTLVSVTADEIRTARREILEYEGIDACNASSTTVAAIRKLVRSGHMGPNDRVLAMITGGDRDNSHHVQAYTRLVGGPGGWTPAPPRTG